jgi:hypothetical protein
MTTLHELEQSRGSLRMLTEVLDAQQNGTRPGRPSMVFVSLALF